MVAYSVVFDKGKIGKKAIPLYQREKTFLLRAAYAATLLALGWLTLRYLLVWLLPFLLALGFAAMMEPLILLCRRKMHLRRSFLAAALTLALLALVITLGAALVGQLLRQANELLNRLPEILAGFPLLADRIAARLYSFCADCPDGIRQWVTQLLDGAGQALSDGAVSLSSTALRLLTTAVAALPQVMLFCATTALALFFTSAAYPKLTSFVRRQLSPHALATVRGIKTSLLTTMAKWLRAQCVLVIITFFQLLSGLLLIRQPYALLLAAVIAFIDALPVFGTGTVLLPWAALCCLAGSFPKGIALTALYLVIWLVRSIMEPKLMAKSAGLPPLPALAAMYVGFCAMGVAGMILGPILLLLIKQLHDGGYLHLWK